jgi:hypothetical protein
MPTLYITEFSESGLAQVPNRAPMAPLPAVASQAVTISGTSAQSSAFNSATRAIRIHTDAICSVLVGANPTAATTSPRMAADQTEYFSVQPGDRIAVISNT